MNRKKTFLFCAALVAGAAAMTFGANDAFAKTKKESLSCKFGKKGFKATLKPSLVASYSSAGGLLTLVGNRQQGLTVSFFTLSVGGVPEPSSISVFPQTFTGGDITYSTGKVTGTPKGWVGGGTMTIVLTGFDAELGRFTGTFSGSMEPGENTPGGTVQVSKGKFTLDLVQ
jgi:hypothetical protein